MKEVDKKIRIYTKIHVLTISMLETLLQIKHNDNFIFNVESVEFVDSSNIIPNELLKQMNKNAIVLLNNYNELNELNYDMTNEKYILNTIRSLITDSKLIVSITNEKSNINSSDKSLCELNDIIQECNDLLDLYIKQYYSYNNSFISTFINIVVSSSIIYSFLKYFNKI